MQRSCFNIKWSFFKSCAEVSFNYWEHTVNKTATQLPWVQDTSPPLPGVGILASIKLLISFQKHFCQLKKSFNTYPSGHEILSTEHLNWWAKKEPIPIRTAPPPKPPEAGTQSKQHPITRGSIYELHFFLWASLPSGSERFQVITGQTRVPRNQNDLTQTQTEKCISGWDFTTLWHCTLESSLCRLVHRQRILFIHLLSQTIQWILGIYAPKAINNYSEKTTLIAFQIKMVLLFPSVNSSIHSQPASLFLLGEDKLTKKHVTNLMHFHFAPVSNVTFVIKHAA